MIKLTSRKLQTFYVNAFAVDIVEPCPYIYGKPERTAVHIAGAIRLCCEEPDDVMRLIDNARTDYKVVDRG